MIALLTGVVVRRSHHDVVLDCNGVGYQVFVSQSTLSKIPEDGEPICLEIYTYVREDALVLFGFADAFEKSLFEMLIGVSGIGPKMGMSILSGLPAQSLVQALSHGDLAALTRISGVGKKTAERLVLELKSAVKKIHVLDFEQETPESTARVSLSSELLSALTNLGYRPHEVEPVVRAVLSEHPNMSIEAGVKEGLRRLRSP